MRRRPRWILAHRDGGWHGRFWTANGKIGASTGSQLYSRKCDAVHIIYLMNGNYSKRGAVHGIEEVDERTKGK